MIYFHWIAGTLLALIWLSRVIDTSFGMRTLVNISRAEWDRNPVTPAGDPRVSIIVPARNEEESVSEALSRLLQLDYSNYEVIAVDDRSTDKTGEIMDNIATCRQGRTRPSNPSLKIIHIKELPSGWMGKAHAMWAAGKQASGDWLLFTDADVMFRPDALRRAIAYAESENGDHLVLFPRMLMKTAGEKMMLAFFQLMFVFGHRPWKVADPKAKDHIGVGAFNLVRRSAYEGIGTYEALRFEVVDDMKLGKLIKNAGLRQRNVVGGNLLDIRWAHGAHGVVRNLTKNFFAVLSFQTWRAIGFCIAAAFFNVLPFAGIFWAHGWARLSYAIALACILFFYIGMSRFSDVRPWYIVLHPVATLMFIYIVLRSMFFALWSGGIEWRGTRYPLEELRKGLV
ncbi:MAG TPA: glycosyltransferase family 2 protein [Terriglobales bacterium]|nr:glycosyltransferase family 2 protein [Terriglobales bacterium]